MLEAPRQDQVTRRNSFSRIQNKGFQQEEVEEYKAVFTYFDAGGKGVITAKQLATTLRALKPKPDEKWIQKEISKINDNLKGECDFDHYLETLHTTIRQANKRQHRKTIYTNISDERRNEIKDAFDMFDYDSDGTISLDELQTVMDSCGIYITEDEAFDIIHEFGSEGRDNLNFNEFLMLMSTKETGEVNSEILECFKFFDRDGDGTISADEVKTVMMALGEDITDGDIFDMIKEADNNASGSVCYQDFLKMMTGHF